MNDWFPLRLKPAGGMCVGMLAGALLLLSVGMLVVAVIGAVAAWIGVP